MMNHACVDACRCLKRQNLYWISEENEKAQECSMKFEARNAKSAVGNSYAGRNTIRSAMGYSCNSCDRNAVGNSWNARDMHMFGKCKQKWIKKYLKFASREKSAVVS